MFMLIVRVCWILFFIKFDSIWLCLVVLVGFSVVGFIGCLLSRVWLMVVWVINIVVWNNRYILRIIICKFMYIE